MDSNGILNSDTFLRDFLRMYIDKESELQQTLILCLMRAFISKANGHKNPHYAPKVENFMLALATTNKPASNLIGANLNLAGERIIRRWAAKERAAPIILNKEADIVSLLVTRLGMLKAGLGKDTRIAFTAGDDATKLVRGFGYFHDADVIVGGAYPKYAIDVSSLSSEERDKRMKAMIEQDGDVAYATEVNIYVTSFQQTPVGISPSMIIAAMPQTTNHSNNWGMEVLDAWYVHHFD